MRSSTISRATDGASVRSVACSTLTSLLICLITCGADLRIDVGDDRHARQRRIERARDRQALNVVVALREQPGDAHQRAGLVLHQNRNDLQHSYSLAQCLATRVTGCGGPSTISLIAPPAGTIG